MESLELVTQALLGLPLPADGDEAHHAGLLRMLGSLQDIRWGSCGLLRCSGEPADGAAREPSLSTQTPPNQALLPRCCQLPTLPTLSHSQPAQRRGDCCPHDAGCAGLGSRRCLLSAGRSSAGAGAGPGAGHAGAAAQPVRQTAGGCNTHVHCRGNCDEPVKCTLRASTSATRAGGHSRQRAERRQRRQATKPAPSGATAPLRTRRPCSLLRKRFVAMQAAMQAAGCRATCAQAASVRLASGDRCALSSIRSAAAAPLLQRGSGTPAASSAAARGASRRAGLRRPQASLAVESPPPAEPSTGDRSHDTDVVVIGSGIGGELSRGVDSACTLPCMSCLASTALHALRGFPQPHPSLPGHPPPPS